MHSAAQSESPFVSHKLIHLGTISADLHSARGQSNQDRFNMLWWRAWKYGEQLLRGCKETWFFYAQKDLVSSQMHLTASTSKKSCIRFKGLGEKIQLWIPFMLSLPFTVSFQIEHLALYLYAGLFWSKISSWDRSVAPDVNRLNDRAGLPLRVDHSSSASMPHERISQSLGAHIMHLSNSPRT